MGVIEFHPTSDQLIYTFGGASPLMTIQPGDVLKLFSEDAFNNTINSVTDLSSAKVDLRFVNPQTGPFYVQGAEVGDTLVIHFVEMKPARSHGASAAIPFFGGLTSTDRTATLQNPLPDSTWIYEVDQLNNKLVYQANKSDFSVELPIECMLGTVGVAPASSEVRSSLVPDRFGGNMDSPEIRPGATLFLRVNVEGALFSIGDGHYRQGEGESCGTAVEGAMNSTILVELIKGHGPSWPRVETDTHFMSIGSSRPLEDAWRIAQVEIVSWIQELYDLDVMDAYQLVSQIAQSPIANVVDVNYSAVVKVLKNLLPRANSYDGLHTHLRKISKNINY